MTKLRLGPILEEKPVKLTIELPGSLYTQLLAYATVHAEQNGLASPLTPERLVGPMLERFMAADRAFSRLRKR